MCNIIQFGGKKGEKETSKIIIGDLFSVAQQFYSLVTGTEKLYLKLNNPIKITHKNIGLKINLADC